MPADGAGFDALVERFMKLGAADRRAVLASLSPGERGLIERELAAARDERRRERDRARLADRQFAGYSPWLAAIIGGAMKDEQGEGSARTAACARAIVLAHRAASEQHDEGRFGRFLRQLGISPPGAVDEPR